MLKAALCLEDADLCREVSGLVKKAFDSVKKDLSVSLAIDLYHTSKAFYKARKAYDLVIIEAWLDGGSGIGLGMYIWQVYRDTKIIMIREREDPIGILNCTHCFGMIDRGKNKDLGRLLDSFFQSVRSRSGKDLVTLRGEEGRIVEVIPDYVMYLGTIPGKRNRVELYLAGRVNAMTIVGTISRLAASFEPYGFIAISQSCSVNPKYVRKAAKEYVTMQNGVNLQISQRRSSYVREMIKKYRYKMIQESRRHPDLQRF